MQSVQIFFLLGAPTLLFAFFYSSKPFAWLCLQKKPTFKQLLWTTLAYAGISPLVNWLVKLNEAIRLPSALDAIERYMLDMEETLRQATLQMLQVSEPIDMVSNWLVVALLAGLVEELFFRGVIQQLVLRSSRRHAFLGILFTAILFSAIHMQFYGFFPRMVLGFMMGYLFYCTGNLWIAIYFHVLNNSIALIEISLTQSTTTQPLFSINQSPPLLQVIFYLAGTFLLCVSMIQLKKTASL